jgi:hypothetical protein
MKRWESPDDCSIRPTDAVIRETVLVALFVLVSDWTTTAQLEKIVQRVEKDIGDTWEIPPKVMFDPTINNG